MDVKIRAQPYAFAVSAEAEESAELFVQMEG
jgi:hypothetical protein